MADDLLAQFRRTSATSDSETEYVAFLGNDNPVYLDIRPASGPENSPVYQGLVNVVNDREAGTFFILVYAFMLVAVRGRNLQDVVTPIKRKRVSFIQQYDPKRWPMPKNDKAPIIESIEIQVLNGLTSELLKH